MKPALLLAGVLSATAAHALVPVDAGCAPSAEAAVSRLISRDHAGPGVSDGFRVVAVRRDPLHKSAWAMIASCADPSRPMQALPVAIDVQSPLSAAVRIGDRVTVVQQGTDSRFTLTAVARDSGAVDAVVRVQMPRLQTDDADSNEPAAIIRCRVIALDVVEPEISQLSTQEHAR